MQKDELAAIQNLRAEGVITHVAAVLRIIQSEIRFRIVIETSERECTVNELARLTRATSQNISGHLKKMKSMRILASRRSGVQIYYRCVDERAAALVRSLSASAGNLNLSLEPPIQGGSED